MISPLEDVEFRLAWRALLDSQELATARYIGWTDQEVQILAGRHGAEADRGAPIDMGTGESTMSVLDASRASMSELIAERGQLQSKLVLVGTPRQVRRVLETLQITDFTWQEHALLPAMRPRIAIPLRPTKALRAGLALHRPGRRVARAAVRILSTLAGLGITLPLRQRVVRIGYSCRLQAPSQASDNLPFPRNLTSVYMGVPGPRRKTVLLRCSEQGHPEVISKSATSVQGREKVLKEARTLQLLASTALRQYAPRLISCRNTEYEAQFIQEYIKSDRVHSRTKRELILGFLLALGRVNHRQITLKEWRLGLLGNNALTCAASIEMAAEICASKTDRLVHTSYVHGDLAEWNTRVRNGKLIVFDWEDFNPNGLCLSDAFRFVVAKELLLRTWRDPERAMRNALAFGNEVGRSFGMGPRSVGLQFVLWCLESTKGFAPEFYLAMARRALIDA